MKKQKIYVIVGPTASGKSHLALQLAQKIGGVIVNADASQVYQGLRILTARPSIEDESKIPHYLYGYMDNHHQENVQGWLKRVCELLPTLQNPIVVGGTGLYVHALLHGISSIPDIPDSVRQQVRQMSVDEVKQRLSTYDVAQDPQRQKRILEVLLSTGHLPSFFYQQQQTPLSADFWVILVQPDRQVIYQNCAIRLQQMFDSGVIQEVQSLLSHHPTGGVLKAIGVLSIQKYLAHEISLQEAQQQILLDTRHYAKRQMTWFRHQLSEYLLYQNQTLDEIITNNY